MDYERQIIVILGPTASGKSALGVLLAKKFHGVVISADSRQVYKGLDIGTAKITKQEMRGVPHYLLSVASPRNQYTVARYVRDVSRVLKRLTPSTSIFLVGGSPFYIDALLNPLLISPVPPNPVLRRRLAAWGTNRLIGQLRKLDPARVKTIDLANRRRLIRAIEIALHTPLPEVADVPKPLWRRLGGRAGGVGGNILKIGISIPRTTLYRRIDRRVDKRLRQGMIAEVAGLHRQGISWNRLDSFGLEYRWISRYLQQKITRDEMIVRLKGDNHSFTRRQMTWWKRDTAIQWITKPSQAVQLVKKHFTLSSRM